MYSIGVNRLFYQSKEETQQAVAAVVVSPNLEEEGPFNMVYRSNGLYYLDFCFSMSGSHVFYVYENEVKRHNEILVVSNSNLIIYPRD